MRWEEAIQQSHSTALAGIHEHNIKQFHLGKNRVNDSELGAVSNYKGPSSPGSIVTMSVAILPTLNAG